MNELVGFFKMLSDETRIRILVILYGRKLCVCQLCGIMGESQPKISKHLAKLRDVGFVKDERKEQFIYYYLNLDNKLFEGLIRDIAANIEAYDILKKDAEKMYKAEEFLSVCKR